MSWAALDWSILGPPLAAGALVSATHVPLGREVLRRGIIFIDLAIAQVAALGVLTVEVVDVAAHGLATQTAAVGAALAAALALQWTERRWPNLQEALIGTLFVLAATGAILVLANDPRGGEHLERALAGQILWTGYRELAPVAIVYALVLALWFGWRPARSRLGFYALFALTVTASVQIVGVYLVFASLIVPALAVARIGAHGLAVAYAVAVIGYAVGLTLAALLDLPAGATVVWALALAALATAGLVVRKRD